MSGNQWVATRLGWMRQWKLLRISLFETNEGWEVSAYLVPGVAIGYADHTVRLVRRTAVCDEAQSLGSAKQWAVDAIERWFTEATIDRIKNAEESLVRAVRRRDPGKDSLA